MFVLRKNRADGTVTKSSAFDLEGHRSTSEIPVAYFTVYRKRVRGIYERVICID